MKAIKIDGEWWAEQLDSLQLLSRKVAAVIPPSVACFFVRCGGSVPAPAAQHDNHLSRAFVSSVVGGALGPAPAGCALAPPTTLLGY